MVISLLSHEESLQLAHYQTTMKSLLLRYVLHALFIVCLHDRHVTLKVYVLTVCYPMSILCAVSLGAVSLGAVSLCAVQGVLHSVGLGVLCAVEGMCYSKICSEGACQCREPHHLGYEEAIDWLQGIGGGHL